MRSSGSRRKSTASRMRASSPYPREAFCSSSIGGASFSSGAGKLNGVVRSSIGTEISCIFSSILTRDWAWRALEALARKRSTKAWRWALLASCFARWLSSCAVLAARSFNQASYPPGHKESLQCSRAIVCVTQRLSNSRSWETMMTVWGYFFKYPSSQAAPSRSR